jgi:hypothetical protein
VEEAMEDRFDNPILIQGHRRDSGGNDREFDLETLLHPGRVFAHPMDVVRDPKLSLGEKRAVLASWASDTCAVEAAPALRRAPGSDKLVNFDDVMDALRALDKNQQGSGEAPSQSRPSMGPRGGLGILAWLHRSGSARGSSSSSNLLN